jgi:tRNA-dihydrouridine synthase 3
MSEHLPNPVEPEQSLKRPIGLLSEEQVHSPQPVFPADSALTKTEKVERNGTNVKEEPSDAKEPAPKRVKMEDPLEGVVRNGTEETKLDSREKVKGIALVKTELVLRVLRINMTRLLTFQISHRHI